MTYSISSLHTFLIKNRRDIIVLLKMLAPVLFILVISIAFHVFVINAIEANLAINCGIIAAASYGVILILVRLVSAQQDFRIIERFGHEAAQGVFMKDLLEQPWLKRRYVRHYLSHIAHTGGTLTSHMDQSAIESELHALQGEYESKLELPQFLVGFMIAMGLLGTFIGLLETLTGIAGMLDGMGGSGGDVQAQFMKLIVELRKPLAGMGIAFSASMFGLITSLMLAVMMTNLRRYISRVMAIARNVMHELTEMSHAADATTSSKHLSPEEVARLAPLAPLEGGRGGAISVSNSMIAGRFDVLSNKIEALLVGFEASIASTQKMTDLLAFGPRMRETSDRSLDELKSISAKHGDQQKLLQNLVDVNVNVLRALEALSEGQLQSQEQGESTVGALKGLTLSLIEQQQISKQGVEVSGGIARIVSSLLDAQKQAKEVGDQMLLATKNLTVGQEEQRKLSQRFVDVGEKTVYVTEALLTVQKQAAETDDQTLRVMKDVTAGQEEQRKLVQIFVDTSEKTGQTTDMLLALQKQAGDVSDQTLHAVKAFVSGQVEQRKLAQSLLDANNKAGLVTVSIMDAQQHSHGETVALIQNLIEHLAKVEDINIGSSRHLWDIKENFIKLCKSMGIVDMIASGIGGHTLLLEALVDETRRAHEVLSAIQRGEQGPSPEQEAETILIDR